MKNIILLIITVLTLSSCSENYSNGERIGVITQFSHKGILFKSWDGHLNVTQTGMNSAAVSFDFSIDNDHEDQTVINAIDSAAQHGWKVKLIYHETFGKNWFRNRGETDHFITNVEVLDKNFGDVFGGKLTHPNSGHTIDTIWVVLDQSKVLKQINDKK